ncbi:MAG: FAD-binding protein [Myxococcota bacterium]
MTHAAILLDEPLSRHTAMRTGGSCDAFVVAHDEEAVHTVLSDCKDAGWPVTVLGSGTRSVVREGGVDGVVLRLGQAFVTCRFVDPDLLVVGGAMPVPALLAIAAEHGLAADPVLYTVPGTFGASVLMDEWNVKGARVARNTRISEVDASALGPRFKGVVLEATVQLERVGVGEADRRLVRALQKPDVPASSWVSGARSVRSVLRRASLERIRLRQVAIPVEAPELMVNLGGGTARDMQLLHKSAVERVRRVRGVKLDTRIKWIGNRSEQ